MPIKKKKKTKVKKKIINKVAKESSKELIIKTKPQWIKSSLANKSKYQDKYSLNYFFYPCNCGVV